MRIKRSELKKWLEEYKKLIGVEREVRLRLKVYKTRAATADLSRGVLILNKSLLDLGEDVVKYLILHELVHLKLGSPHHDARFWKLLEHYAHALGIDILSAQNKIIGKLFEINGIGKKGKN